MYSAALLLDMKNTYMYLHGSEITLIYRESKQTLSQSYFLASLSRANLANLAHFGQLSEITSRKLFNLLETNFVQSHPGRQRYGSLLAALNLRSLFWYECSDLNEYCLWYSGQHRAGKRKVQNTKRGGNYLYHLRSWNTWQKLPIVEATMQCDND